MSKLSWRAKAVYLIFALALVLGLSAVAAPAPQQAAAADGEETNTLRVYGSCDLGENGGDAAFPYTDANGPFSPQSDEVPVKDFIVWNPAYMYHLDPASLGIYGNFFESIVVNGNDANEKVHLRQWYVPKYPEPRGIVWTCQDPVYWPEIVKEYTYLLLDTDNNPQPGLPGMTSFVFPIADNDDAQCGLDDVDMNGDGVADVVYLATTSAVDPTLSPTYPYGVDPAYAPPEYQPQDEDALWPPYDTTSGCSTATAGLTTAANEIVGGTKWIDINTDQFAVSVGDVIRFLDHVWVITGVSPTGITVDSYYSGNSADGSKKTTTIPIGQTASRGRHLISVEDLTLMAGGTTVAFYPSPPLPPSQSDRFRLGVSKLQLVLQPGYLQVITSGATSAQIVVGRVIAEGETFFVDGAEYDVAMLYFVPTPQNTDPKDTTEYGLKFITIRNPIPKWDPVTLEALTIVKCAVQPGQPIPLLPPFNMVHDMIDDTNIPDALYAVDAAGQPIPHPDVQKPDNVADAADLAAGPTAGDDTLVAMGTWLPVADGFGDVTFLPLEYNTIAERRVHDVPPIVEWFEQEAKEPRFDTNLLEEKFLEYWSPFYGESLVPGEPEWADEQWLWKNIETLPWYYTEFVLPELPDITDPVNNDDGDYILVSSWITQDGVRMKFVYDAIPSELWSADIYVNDPSYNQRYQQLDEMSLRVYGACGEDAEFPYDYVKDPFSIQDPDNPPKDFIVWNPAYMYHLDPASLGIYGNFFESIVVNGNDANEKVHLRQWYVPKYKEPRGNVWTCQTPVYWPEIVKEYTYLLLDTDNNPQPGLPGMTSFMFPIADNDDAQCGLDDVDMNGDGVADVVYLATTSALDPDASADPVYTNPDSSQWAPADGPIPQPRAGDDWDAPHDALWPPVDTTNACPGFVGETRWIDINTDQFAVSVGDEIRFLDHAWVITGISPTGITVESYYSGNSADGSKKTTTIPIGQTASRGRHLISVEDLTLMAGGIQSAFYQSPPLPPSQSDRFRVGVSKLQLVLQPGYLQVITSGATSAQIVVGRVIAEGETFFVDGAEYDVAMLYFVPTPSNGDPKDTTEYGLKFITIRNPIPKWEPVTLEALTIVKCALQPGQPIPLLPPFNMEHDMIDDVNIPEMVQGMQLPDMILHADGSWHSGLWWPDLQMPDNLADELDVYDNVETFFAYFASLFPPHPTFAPVVGADGYGDYSFLHMDYNTITERRVQDVPAIVEWFKHEAKEPRFDTNLLEEKFVEDAACSEYWMWKNIETHPWLYTEFVLPELPEAAGLEAMGKIGDYILVSSFLSQVYDPLGCLGDDVRMKFVYDAAFSPDYPEKTGIYVNTIGVAVVPLEADADGPYYGLPDESIAISGSATGGTPPYSFAWDLDYDGLYDDSFVQNPTWSWPDEGDYTIGLEVTDDAMAVDTDTAIVHISLWNPWDYDTNENGVIDIGEVLAAIVDYFDGVIDISQVLEVIVLYFSP